MKIIRYFFITIISVILLITIPLNVTLLTLNQSILKPYSSIEYFKEMDVMGEMRKKFKIENEEYIDKEWLEGNFIFIQKEIWDYVTEKDTNLEPIDMKKIEEKMVEKANEKLEKLPKSEKEKVIAKIRENVKDTYDWSSDLKLSTEKMDKAKEIYRYQQKALTILNITNLLLIAIKVLLIFNPKKSMKWVSNVAIVSGVTGMLPFVLWKMEFQEKIINDVTFESTFLTDIINVLSSDFLVQNFYNSLILFMVGVVLGIAIKIKTNLN